VRFVDSSFWVALLVPRDARHQEAKALWRTSRTTLLTTSHVVGETWTFLRRRAGHSAAVSFLDATGRSERLVVVHVDQEIERAAFDWLRRHDERVYSFVDATSFEVMRRRRLSEALAFDGDFAAAGFVEARAGGD
jgi:predicted nucleic acid-binding protein